MEKKNSRVITRRQAIVSLAAITAGAFVRPTSIFGVEAVKNKLRFAVLGDWGTGCEDQAGLANQMIAAHRQSAYDFVLAAGDNIYPNGSGRYFTKKFEQPFAGLLNDRVNFYAVLGNHDIEDGRQDQLEYPLFNMDGQNYYKLSKGDGLVDFFMLDSNDFDDAQIGWADNALRTSTAKWKIVVAHHPVYSSGKKHGPNPRMRRCLEPLLVKYKVNAVFAGHDHIYERIKPQQGVHHFVTGAGGKMRRGGIDKGSELTAVGYDNDNHFMVVEVDDKAINFKAISETGETVDSGAITGA